MCCHLIVGLPGETPADHLATLRAVVDGGVDGIKLHPLHIVSGSTMARAWRAGRLATLTLDEYAASAGEMIRHTPREVVFHRISASARPRRCWHHYGAQTAGAACRRSAAICSGMAPRARRWAPPIVTIPERRFAVFSTLPPTQSL
ncbi:hypothetical protein GGER_46800 [Serratia rubidaea]